MTSTTHAVEHGAAAMEHAAAAAEHGSGGMPQLDFSTYASQIFWLAVAIFVLYRLLSRSVLPKIHSTLEERSNAITGDLDKAAELKRQAEAAGAAYERALAEARANAQTIAAAAKAEMDAQIEAATAKAEAEIAARAAESEARIDAIRRSSVENVQTVAADVGEAILGRLMPSLSDAEAIRKAVAAHLSK